MKPDRLPPAAEDLVATAQTLWPAPATAALVRGGDPAPGERVLREFAFLPNAARPRLIVPVGVPAAAAAALRRYSQALSGKERYGRAALSVALRTGLGERLLPDRVRVSVPTGHAGELRSVEDVLAEVLGEPVVVSLGLGNRRANQKPILHVLTPAGQTRAFVKVGDNEMSRTLVRGEADALRRVAGLPLRRVTAPNLIDLVSWHGLELLILSPLPTTAKPTQDATPYEAIAELAAATGVLTAGLTVSEHWRQTRKSVAAVADAETRGRLVAVVDQVERRHGDTAFQFGCWHGDFTPWNLQWRGDGIVLWDWERFATGVPLGFDALHYRQALDQVRLGDANAATRALGSHAEAELAKVGVPAGSATATTTLYLLELCIRFLLAAQLDTGEPLRERASWLLDHLVTRSAS
jgi:hypothetical protein